MNLFLYIHTHSSHLSGLTKSIITGLVEIQWQNNSEIREFIEMTQLLHKRLLVRGRNATNINLIDRWYRGFLTFAGTCRDLEDRFIVTAVISKYLDTKYFSHKTFI